MTMTDKSGATVWEIRDMARQVEKNGVIDLIREDVRELCQRLLMFDDQDDRNDEINDYRDIGPLIQAIIVEALNCLADKKETEKGR